MRLLFTFLVIYNVVLIGSTESILAAEEEQLESGQKIFVANCVACHAGGNNLIMPEKTLEKSVLEANSMNSISAIVNQVTYGKSAMPAFGERLSADDITDVANYVLHQSAAGWPNP
uniref:Cytochrome c-553 n=1 Tax=Inkyuleea mariana TaxID=123988 RepID=A0A4D6X2P7_9FLOR|nr:cytochrome c553 [Inkyuleea mariana]